MDSAIYACVLLLRSKGNTLVSDANATLAAALIGVIATFALYLLPHYKIPRKYLLAVVGVLVALLILLVIQPCDIPIICYPNPPATASPTLPLFRTNPPVMPTNRATLVRRETPLPSTAAATINRPTPIRLTPTPNHSVTAYYVQLTLTARQSTPTISP